MAGTWYYVDNNGQQVGPVGAEEVRDAVRRGAATMASLGWRDGLPNWLPLSQLAAELGLDASMAAPTMVSAPSAVPGVRPPSDANPYRAPESDSNEGYVEGGGDIVYAGFWRRWAALFLDQLIIGIPLSMVLMVGMIGLGISQAGAGGQPDPAQMMVVNIVYYAVWISVGFFYYTAQESSEAQATLGKRALGIKVTDLEGRRLSFRQAAIRWVSAAVSYMSLYIGFAMAGFTQRKQALHDYMASTLVVDKWAFTRHPDRQQRGLHGCLIAFIAVIVVGLVFVLIAFAIAISQYKTYMNASTSPQALSTAATI